MQCLTGMVSICFDMVRSFNSRQGALHCKLNLAAARIEGNGVIQIQNANPGDDVLWEESADQRGPRGPANNGAFGLREIAFNV